MTAANRKPAEILVQEAAMAAGKDMVYVISLGRCGEVKLAADSARKCQEHSRKAEKLAVIALKQNLILTREAKNLALGYVEDARLFGNASIACAKSAARRKLTAGSASSSFKASAEAVAYMAAAAEVLFDTLKGGCAVTAMHKAADAVVHVTELTDEATKAGDPGAEDAVAAKAVVDDIAKRTTILGESAKAASRRHQIGANREAIGS
ncbi:MAG: hypothetical protein WCJ64_26045 [Rhodospirillaceae bacterium]